MLFHCLGGATVIVLLALGALETVTMMTITEGFEPTNELSHKKWNGQRRSRTEMERDRDGEGQRWRWWHTQGREEWHEWEKKMWTGRRIWIGNKVLTRRASGQHQWSGWALIYAVLTVQTAFPIWASTSTLSRSDRSSPGRWNLLQLLLWQVAWCYPGRVEEGEYCCYSDWRLLLGQVLVQRGKMKALTQIRGHY